MKGVFVSNCETFKFSELTDRSFVCGKQKVLPPRFLHRSLPLGSQRATTGNEIRDRTWEECRRAMRDRTKGICLVHACIGAWDPRGFWWAGAVPVTAGQPSPELGFQHEPDSRAPERGLSTCSELGGCWKSTLLDEIGFLPIYRLSLHYINCSVCSSDAPKYWFAIAFLFAKVKIVLLVLIPSSCVKGFFFPSDFCLFCWCGWGEGSLKWK